MNKPRVIRWLLIFFLLASCFVDIYATISDPNFLVLEGNFVANIIGSVYPVVLFKIFFCVALAVAISLPKFLAKSNFAKYFYIHIIVLLTFLQLVAGASNIVAKQQVTNF